MYQQATGPQSIGGVLDSGFRLYRECVAQTFWFALVLGLFTAPFGLAGPLIAGREITPSLGAGIVVAVLVIVVVASILQGSMIARVDAVARGAPISAADALGIGLRRWPAVVGAALLMSVAVFGLPGVVVLLGWLAGVQLALMIGFGVLLALPFTIILIWLIFGPYLAVIDRLGPIKSLSFSRALTRGHWWRTTALITILTIIAGVIDLVFGIIFAAVLLSNPTTAQTGQPPLLLQLVANPLLQVVLAPLILSLFMSILYDLKLRHEGGDLAARIAASA
jgi:hypothetical protein